jgi:uncharacterized membrane protein
MFKKLVLFLTFLMLVSISAITMNGCAKQEAQDKPAAEQLEEEAAPDTTEVMEEAE